MTTDRLADECHGYDLDGNPLSPRTRLLETALEEWAWIDNHNRCFAGDDLIAMAVGHVRQPRWRSAPLTTEDAAILRQQTGALIDAQGSFYGFPGESLVRVCTLNL